MDVFGKQPRLYSVNQRVIPRTFSNRPPLYDDEDELGVEYEEEEEETAFGYDPHTELQQRRAELDHRLKNTFESIFEKYERDFDGIGDEIDLATGEIVVNNGHLIEMMDERDAGLRSTRRNLAGEFDSQEELTEDEESIEGDEAGSESDESGDVEEEENDDEEDDDQDEEVEPDDEQTTTEGESMDDDDLILRGFTQANRFAEASPDLGTTRESYLHQPISKVKQHRNLESNFPPLHSDIVAQFGPQLGPQIVNYINQQEQLSRKESQIESAWRVPELPGVTPKHRPVQKVQFKAPRVPRSPSPDASISVWAVPRPRRKRQNGVLVGTVSLSYPLPRKSTANEGGDSGKKRRNAFTEEEDETMLEYVAKAQRNGTPLFSSIIWKALAAQHPRHTSETWKTRYFRTFYIPDDHDLVQDSEKNPVGRPDHSAKQTNFTQPPEKSDRPNRARKPVQRDSRIVSWSEAVNTIASVDPVLHASMLDDARRAENGESSWVFGHPTPNHDDWNMRRPASAHEVDELQRDYGSFHQMAPRRYSDSRVLHPEQNSVRFPKVRTLSSRRIPCPHANCRQFAQNLYRADLRHEESISELTRHLLNEHHITPFPCGEEYCSQSGKNGFFRQEDLVQHVRMKHPNTAAMKRLQGRVESPLLGLVKKAVCIDLTSDSPARKVRQNSVEFDFSNEKPPHSDATSSVGHYRNTTPATATGALARPSVSTPLTSYSSLAVNHSSATIPGREIRDSQEPFGPQSSQYISFDSDPFTINDDPSHVGQSEVVPGHSAEQSLEQFTNTLRSSSDPFANSNLPVSQTEQKVGEISCRKTRGRKQPQQTPLVVSHSEVPETPIVETSNQELTPSNLSIPVVEIDISNTSITRKKLVKSKPPIRLKQTYSSKKSQPKETFTRNTVPASHEFSDEEIPMLPPISTIKGPPLLARSPSTANESMPPPKSIPQHSDPPVVFSTPSTPLPITPLTRKKGPRSGLEKVIAQDDDIDELSLGTDELSVITSHHKSVPHLTFGLHNGIKREGTVQPHLSLGGISKKRRFTELTADDEVDELGADKIFGKSSGPKIKREVDLDGTPMVHRVKAQRRETKKAYREELKNGPSGLPPPFSSPVNPQSGRASTPLLDLTPKKEPNRAGDHTDESPPISRPAHHSGFAVPSTPSRSKPGPHNLLRSAGAAIVVKTPCGTYRRCGEGAFRCGRTFCFRCSSDMAATSSSETQ